MTAEQKTWNRHTSQVLEMAIAAINSAVPDRAIMMPYEVYRGTVQEALRSIVRELRETPDGPRECVLPNSLNSV